MSPPSVIPANFLIPTSDVGALVIEFPYGTLRMAAVDKDQVRALDDTWDASGIYILFGPGSEPETFAAYVGKAPSGVRSRVLSHAKKKEGWDRALLVMNSGSEGLDSAEVGWLEGRVHRLLEGATRAELMNEVTPGDRSLPDWKTDALEGLIPLVAGTIRALGYRTDRDTSVEDELQAPQPGSSGPDWDLLHRLLAVLPEGRWTTYGDLAKLVGTASQPLGMHIRSCAPECQLAYKVLDRNGQLSPGFTWIDPADDRDPLSMLEIEGVNFDGNGRASQAQRLSETELRHLATASTRDQ